MNTIRDVIWVASYPKSGNSWVHDVLRTAGKRTGFPTGPMDIYDMVRNDRRPEICPAVLPEITRNECSVLKTHTVYSTKVHESSFTDMQLRTAAFIYIYRNPLDLLLSYINFTRLEYASNDDEQYRQLLFRDLLGMDGAPTTEEWASLTLDDMPRASLDHALRVFSDRGLTLPTCFPSTPWSSHVRGWLDARKQHPSVVLRYEDCVTDRATFNPMAALFEFGAADIQKALQSSAHRTAMATASGTPQERIFYNKMRAYYYPAYFSSQVVRDFVDTHREVLDELGYDNITAGAGSGERAHETR